MGTRAYRERERRLHQQLHSGVLSDTVTVDFGTLHSAEKAIRVEKELEIREEIHPKYPS